MENTESKANEIAQETRDIIKDNETILSMSDEERTTAEKIAREYAPDDETSVRQTLSAIRTIRDNKGMEEAARASYKETKTLEAVLNAVRSYRTQRAARDEKIELIQSDIKYSEAYKTELINEQREAFRKKADAARETTRQLMDEIISDRVAYDKAFFTDADRLKTANRVIEVLKNAGKNISPEDFASLVEPIFGDAAACRYVSASIKDSPVMFKRVIDSMGIRTEAAFERSTQLLDNLFSGSFAAYGVEETLLAEASKVGIALTVTDYSQPVYSESRNRQLEPEINDKELTELIRKSMRGY